MTLNSRINAARRRAALMGSTAFMVAALAVPAHAQDVEPSRPAESDVELIQISGGGGPAQSNDEAISDSTNLDGASAPGATRLSDYIDPTPHTLTGNAFITPLPDQETPSIVINNNFTAAQRFDAANVTGIGQVITDAGGGFIGTCTGTLINRRTVIFAAHCVNTRAATAYGANTGGVGAAVAFETNTRSSGTGQPDELLNWLIGGGTGQFQTNRAASLYNIRQIFYDPRSRAPASCTVPTSCFLEADVAVAVLDTPTRDVPLWTVLFSPLVSPGTINPANGTGYHVTIAGYGNTGNGTTGANATGGFRRRIAENILGGLTSLNERNIFLFGNAGAPSRPQLLYWLDFDDPARGTATANSRDFNGFRDNALAREGSTGPGDSGGPLIIDQAFGQNIRTVIGVLSGGSTFFQGQPGGSYGTQSFYQPLFLYWDWIVANNPYRYATAVAGNRNWEDPTAWVTTLDPAYQVLVNGVLTNGIPTNLGGANTVTNPQFGEFCFQSPSNSPNPAVNECEDVATGTPRNSVPNNPSNQTPVGGAPTVQIVGDEASGEGQGQGQGNAGTQLASNEGGAARGDLDGAFESPNADPGFSNVLNAPPTLANGLPGATNFVPNNTNGDRLTGVSGRYYDITLRNAGTVTLSSGVTIDNFAIAGAQSQLTVAANGSLTSLLDINHMTGIMNVNGTATALGDYFFMSGLLTGSGRVNANFLTSVMGNFAPGTLGTIGTLTIGGNLIMASGSTYALDVGASGSSDLIAVVANGTSTGTANVGGRVIVSSIPGSIVRFNNLYTILTAAGGVTGTFTSTDISAILRQQFIYNPNSVQLRITAVSYASVVDQNAGIQRAFATLLDNNRTSPGLAGLYDFFDLQNQATIRATLDTLAPRTEQLAWALGTTAIDNNRRVIRDRLQSVQPGQLGGQIAYYGRRVETAALSLAGMSNGAATMSDISIQPDMVQTRLPDTMSAFFAAGYLEGQSAPLADAQPFAGDDQFDGFYFTAGIEKQLNDRTAVGVAFSYTDLEGTTAVGGQSAEGQLYQGTIYGKMDMSGPLVLDGQLALGMLNIDTLRPASLPGQTINLTSDSSSLTASGEIGIAALFGQNIRFGPRGALRASYIDFGEITETGGITALTIDRETYDSIQARLGLVVEGVGRIRPNATATYVHEFSERAAGFAANFAGGVGSNVLFDIAGNDQDWFEVSGGLTLDLGRFEFSVAADTTLDREDVENQSYRATIKFDF